MLRLQEVATPTIIQQPGVGDMKAVVLVWVESDTGRLIRSQVTARDVRIGIPAFDTVVRVDFQHHDTIGFMVPFEMSETFFAGRNLPGGTGTAKYTNYRRFQTRARIIPQAFATVSRPASQ